MTPAAAMDPRTAQPPNRLASMALLPCIDSHQRRLPRRHLRPAREGLLRRPLHLRGHLRLDFLEPCGWHALRLQVFLVQPDRVALPPCFEQLGLYEEDLKAQGV